MWVSWWEHVLHWLERGEQVPPDGWQQEESEKMAFARSRPEAGQWARRCLHFLPEAGRHGFEFHVRKEPPGTRAGEGDLALPQKWNTGEPEAVMVAGRAFLAVLNLNVSAVSISNSSQTSQF